MMKEQSNRNIGKSPVSTFGYWRGFNLGGVCLQETRVMSLLPPVPFSPDVEQLQPNEQEVVNGLVETFDFILERTSADYGHAVRSVHAKAHGILAGEMIIEDNLPEELAQGLFAKPGRHKVYLRLSTNAGDILPDDISLPRGLAMKGLDVSGERLPDAAGPTQGRTQDFLMVNGP